MPESQPHSPAHSPTTPATVEVLDGTHRLNRDQLTWLTQHIQKAIQHLGATGEVRVRVVDDAEMAKAHEEFAGVPGTTDVLTFDLNDPEDSPVPELDLELGKLVITSSMFGLDTDILVCLDEADRHAAGPKGGYPVERELLLYVVHGVLHCLGMDDHEEAAFAAMHRVEDLVLRGIGVGPVFETGASEGLGAAG